MFIHLQRRGNVVLRRWRCTASRDEHGGMVGKEMIENQRRNKKEYIIRKKGRKRKETAQFSPIFKFLNASFSLFQHNTDNCGYRKHTFSFSYKRTRYGFLQPSNNSTIRNVRLWPSCQSTRTKQCVDDSGRRSFSCALQQGQERSLSVQRNASEPCLVTDGLEMCPNMRMCSVHVSELNRNFFIFI